MPYPWQRQISYDNIFIFLHNTIRINNPIFHWFILMEQEQWSFYSVLLDVAIVYPLIRLVNPWVPLFPSNINWKMIPAPVTVTFSYCSYLLGRGSIPLGNDMVLLNRYGHYPVTNFSPNYWFRRPLGSPQESCLKEKTNLICWIGDVTMMQCRLSQPFKD